MCGIWEAGKIYERDRPVYLLSSNGKIELPVDWNCLFLNSWYSQKARNTSLTMSILLTGYVKMTLQIGVL